jgi:type I restriction enzyme S subunit
MSEWKEYRLGDISTMKYGKLCPNKTCGNIPIHSGYRVVGYTDQSNCPANTVIVVARGVGGCGDVKLLKEPVFLTNLSISVSIDSKVCLPLYFYYYHLLNNLRWLDSGSAQSQITIEDLKKYTFSIPSIATQHKIAFILSSLDDKIAVNKKICENLEAQAQALFKHWFVDFAPFKDGKFVESELGLIPEGWREGRLEELCSFISRGLSPKYQLGTNELVLGQTCVRNNVVTLDNAREHQPKVNCNKFVEKWDVLLNSTGIGSLGRVGIIYFNNKNVCFDSHLTVVRTAEEIYRYYVGRNLLNRQKELENMAVGSTGQTELPKKDVLVMPILIPNSDVLPEFNEIIKNIGNTIYILIEENRRLSTLRDTLLPKLMSGQIKINEIEKSL